MQTNGANKTLCTPRSRERSSDLHKRLSQTCLWVFECLLWRYESAVACRRNRDSGSSSPGLGGAVCWHKYFWRRSPLLPLPHHSLASGQTTGREHSPAHQQKIGLKIYWAWPLKAISPEHSLEGLMLKLKLKLQYFGHLMRRTDLLEKTLTLGKIEGRRRRWRQRMRWLDGITN